MEEEKIIMNNEQGISNDEVTQPFLSKQCSVRTTTTEEGDTDPKRKK